MIWFACCNAGCRSNPDLLAAMNQFFYNTKLDSFQALWQRCLRAGIKDESSTEVYHRLIKAYKEPQRVYHTLNHIKSCFAMFEEVKHLPDNPDALALAIWFHDAIYEIGNNDNEQRSADWFMSETNDLFDDKLREQVYAHIMATLHCGHEIENLDSQYMVDIDLSSFGKPWPEFLRDSGYVRKERPDISDEVFYAKQCDFQKVLIERPRFYQSDFFFEHYEDQARQNLTKFFTLVGKKYSH